MFNPAYLVKSRCGIFHLRWPIPKQLHPQKKASTLKLSLATREPQKALRLSRSLSHIGERLNELGIAYGMRHDELRAVLTAHFRALLDQAKTRMNDQGPLSKADRDVHLTSRLLAEDALETDTPLFLASSDDDLLSDFIRMQGLSIDKGSAEYLSLRREIKLSYRGYIDAVLAYDSSLQKYDFETDPIVDPTRTLATRSKPGLTINEVAAAYSKERQRGNAWAPKTITEKADHLKLLVEILDGDTDVRSITAMDASRVKDTLLAYPRNRSKNPLTRGKPLTIALRTANVEKIQVPTINKYLQTYNDLFEWTKQNNHIDQNFFPVYPFAQRRKGGQMIEIPFPMLRFS